MDYEQKYKEALERAKKVHDYSSDLAEIKRMEKIFPELRESEDEKIRKMLIDSFTRADMGGEIYGKGVTYKQVIAWLEKQGTPNQVSIWKHWKDGIAGNGEGKPIYLVKIGNTYSLNSCLGFECDYIELSELDNLMLVKQGQKHVPDIEIPFGAKDSKLQEATYLIPEGFHAEIKNNEVLIKKDERKSAWTEEDAVGWTNTMIMIKECASNHYTKDSIKLVIDWLKSIKDRVQPQSQWKPSKEQMKALADALSLAKNCGEERAFDLRTLYEQLKKLKRE